MGSRLYISAITLLVAGMAYSQEAVVADIDSLSASAAATEASAIIDADLEQATNGAILPHYGLSRLPHQSTLTVSPHFYDRNAVMPRLGGLGGYVTSTSLPGLMGIESGSLSYTFASDRLSFTPSVMVNKYGYFGGLTMSLGFGGEMSIKISDTFSVTAFGAYHTNAWAANPAVMANMMSSRWGGYGTWNINDSWGLSVGAQRVMNSATGQWQTVPIVMPTFKINGRDAIGIDLGGLLYEVYQMVDMHKRRGGFGANPTIGPPDRPQMIIR